MAADTTGRTLVGRPVHDRHGEEIGSLEEVHHEPGTDTPAWGLVKTGRFGRRRIVPLRDAEESEDQIRIPVHRHQVEDAPELERGHGLTPDLEERLRDHYEHHGEAEDAAAAQEHDEDSRRARRGLMAEARDRQREEFGGFDFPAVLFGWLVAMGIAVLLTAIVAAAGAAVGLTELEGASDETIGIGGGVLLVLVLALAYYAGGYVAGRLSRFDGARQGLGVWIFGLLVTLLLAAAGAIFGSEYNVLEQMNLPRIPVEEGSLTTGAVVALAVVLVVTLLVAVVGAKAGERYHRRVDRVAYEA